MKRRTPWRRASAGSREAERMFGEPTTIPEASTELGSASRRSIGGVTTAAG